MFVTFYQSLDKKKVVVVNNFYVIKKVCFTGIPPTSMDRPAAFPDEIGLLPLRELDYIVR